jgi:hypothetical protein
MPALASEVFGLAHLAGNYALLSVRSVRLLSIWSPASPAMAHAKWFCAHLNVASPPIFKTQHLHGAHMSYFDTYTIQACKQGCNGRASYDQLP